LKDLDKAKIQLRPELYDPQYIQDSNMDERQEQDGHNDDEDY
jgi:hypothetical protein